MVAASAKNDSAAAVTDAAAAAAAAATNCEKIEAVRQFLCLIFEFSNKLFIQLTIFLFYSN